MKKQLKQLKQIGIVILIGITVTVFNGCAGKDGAPGAQGPAGNANVWASNYIVPGSNWVFNSLINEWSTSFSESDISSAIVNSGTVNVFVNYDLTGSTWYAMPYAYEGSELSYSFTYGTITVYETQSNGAAPPPPPAYEFKVVVVPAAIAALHPHLNYKDYTAVSNAYHLSN